MAVDTNVSRLGAATTIERKNQLLTRQRWRQPAVTGMKLKILTTQIVKLFGLKRLLRKEILAIANN